METKPNTPINKTAKVPKEFTAITLSYKVGPKTTLHNKMIAEIKDNQSMTGCFGIQHHGKGGVVAFRNIRARKVK